MAGDWIKMRTNLWDDPRVARLCDLTDQGESAVVGGLYWLWAMADSHTEDGILPGLTLRAIDRKTGIKGFGSALCAVGWLEDSPDGVCLVNFEEHNGTSAKRRCTDAQTKASKRKSSAEAPANVGEMSASQADKTQTDDGQKTDNCRAREEKRREEDSSSLRSEEKASASPKPVVVLKASDIEADGVSADHARDWLKARKVPLTLTAWAGIKREADKALIGYGDVVRLMAEKGWRSFDADWVAKARGSPSRQPTSAQMAMAQACPTLVAPHLQAFTPQQTTFVEVIDDDARLLG